MRHDEYKSVKCSENYSIFILGHQHKLTTSCSGSSGALRLSSDGDDGLQV